MKAVRIQVLAICAVAFVLGRSAFGQQGEAERLIAQGDKLAWLKNWQAAEPFFEKAEVPVSYTHLPPSETLGLLRIAPRPRVLAGQRGIACDLSVPSSA